MCDILGYSYVRKPYFLDVTLLRFDGMWRHFVVNTLSKLYGNLLKPIRRICNVVVIGGKNGNAAVLCQFAFDIQIKNREPLKKMWHIQQKAHNLIWIEKDYSRVAKVFENSSLENI